MASPAQVEESLVELSPHAQLPRLDLGIDWQPRGHEFWTSLQSSLSGPKPPKYDDLAKNRDFRVDWIRNRFPFRAFTMASLWHVVAIWLLILPIWGFLPENTPTLAPVQIELTWYGEPQDLPKISLPAHIPKPPAPHKKVDESPKPTDNRGADALHPRQTIVSIPVRVTHPRQTLIRPDAPKAPPKIVPQLPNIVQWSSHVDLPRPKLNLPVSASTPKRREHFVREAAAPDVPNAEKNQGPVNIAASKPVDIAKPQLPMSAMSTPTSRQRETTNNSAPEISSAAGDTGTRNLIALSAAPGPPMPVADVPEGNLAARIVVSPEGKKAGTPNGSEAHGAAGDSGARANGAGIAGGTGASDSSLPAAVSISGGASSRPGGGGLAGAGGRGGTLDLRPHDTYEAPVNTHRGPADVSTFDQSLPPEKILSGSEIYTMHVNLPNVTSSSGSWILNFAELDEDETPGYKHKERLADPVPVRVADPKYPPELIKEHVRGEVVLYAIIRKNGTVDSIQLVRKLDPQLDKNAIEALKQWTFEPATRAHVPVDVEAVIHVPFTYRDPNE